MAGSRYRLGKSSAEQGNDAKEILESATATRGFCRQQSITMDVVTRPQSLASTQEKKFVMQSSSERSTSSSPPPTARTKTSKGKDASTFSVRGDPAKRTLGRNELSGSCRDGTTERDGLRRFVSPASVRCCTRASSGTDVSGVHLAARAGNAVIICDAETADAKGKSAQIPDYEP